MSPAHIVTRVPFPVAALALIIACGGGGVEPDTDGNPIENNGTPAGPPVTVSIGAAGGTVATADGAMSLSIPAGALSKATNVTLRPFVNTAPNSYGLAYGIEPANLQLSQPVHVTMKVDEAQLGDLPPEVLGAAVKNDAGTWMANLTSTVDVPQAAAYSGDIPGAALARARIISVGLDLSGEFPVEVTISAFWRVDPRSASVATGGTVPIRILACIEEKRAIDAEIVTFRVDCSPSIREGTWYVNGLPGGSDMFGKVATLAPSSSARYTAPLQPPPPALKTVTVVARMLWTERNLSKTFLIPITVTGSPEWTGTITYTRKGETSSVDAVGKTHHEAVEGSGTINLRALPGRINPIGGQINAATIAATEKYDLEEHQEGKTDVHGCKSNTDYTEHLTGSGAIIPPAQDPTGSAFIVFTATGYTISLVGFQIDISGETKGTYTTKCAGRPDEVRTVTTNLTIGAGLDPTGPALWTRQFDPANPGRLSGSETFRDSGQPWVTVTVTWDLIRP